MTHDPLCLCEQCVAHDILCPVNTATAADMEAAGVKWVCACDLIARVREDEHKRITKHDRHSGLACWTNYAAGLSAAREAVADALGSHSPGGTVALAAIDALRGTGIRIGGGADEPDDGYPATWGEP